MAGVKLIAAILLGCVAYVSSQAIVDNLYPKAGDICADKGTSWANIKLGKCEASTKCQAYKRGVYKCVPLDPKLGQMPINTVCYNETKVNQKDKKVGELWRKYYRQRNCVWQGVDVQGTPLVQCVQTQEKGGIYRCKKVMPLFKRGCYVVSGSMIWGKYNDNQAYDACNGCPCTLPGKQGKYPLCRCKDVCDAARQKTRCATD